MKLTEKNYSMISTHSHDAPLKPFGMNHQEKTWHRVVDYVTIGLLPMCAYMNLLIYMEFLSTQTQTVKRLVFCLGTVIFFAPLVCTPFVNRKRSLLCSLIASIALLSLFACFCIINGTARPSENPAQTGLGPELSAAVIKEVGENGMAVLFRDQKTNELILADGVVASDVLPDLFSDEEWRKRVKASAKVPMVTKRNATK